MADTAGILADYILDASFADLPPQVRREGPRALINWLACAVGGSHDDAVSTAFLASRPLAGPPVATILGRFARTDIAHAVLLNCIAGSVQAFDDAHLESLAHPSGPAVAAALAVSEQRKVAGPELLLALLLGIEVQIRASRVVTAGAPIGLYTTGVTGGLGAAAAAGRLLGLDRSQMTAALGLAAAQGGGFRGVHGAMANPFVRANAARGGVVAALYAAAGFTCPPDSLDGPNGFFAVFGGPDADPAAVTRDLGHRFDLVDNGYKPYPCGIPIHPAIDACLEVAPQLEGRRDAIARVTLTMHPVALELCSLRDPADAKRARLSTPHWAAAALLRGAAGSEESSPAVLADPAIAALRQRIDLVADPATRRDQSAVVVALADGQTLSARIDRCRGCIDRPMTDAEIDGKFMAQARGIMPGGSARGFLDDAWALDTQSDAGALIRRYFA